MRDAGGDRRRMAVPPQSVEGPVERVGGCRDRATAPIEDICCEQIRGCSYREAVRPTRCPLRPDSDQILRRSEMTRCAINGLS
jgi:hypothetical protein